MSRRRETGEWQATERLQLDQNSDPRSPKTPRLEYLIINASALITLQKTETKVLKWSYQFQSMLHGAVQQKPDGTGIEPQVTRWMKNKLLSFDQSSWGSRKAG